MNARLSLLTSRYASTKPCDSRLLNSRHSSTDVKGVRIDLSLQCAGTSTSMLLPIELKSPPTICGPGSDLIQSSAATSNTRLRSTMSSVVMVAMGA